MIIQEFCGFIVFASYFLILRFYAFIIFASAWIILFYHKYRRRKSLKQSTSLREQIQSGKFTLEDIPMISYLIKESSFEKSKYSFEVISNQLKAGLILGVKDLPNEILANISIGENKSVLVIEITYEDPNIRSSNPTQKFSLVKTLFIEFSYSLQSDRYLFRSPYFIDTAERSQLRSVVFQIEDYLLKGNDFSPPKIGLSLY